MSRSTQFRRTRRPVICAVAAAFVLTLGAASADAQPKQGKTVTFDVGYKLVASDCTGVGVGMKLGKGTLTMTQLKDPHIKLRIPGVPDMKGTRGRGGKFKARARSAASADGITGRYKASGKAKKGSVDLMLIAEFYRGKDPVCTQSWWATGARR